MTDMSEEKKVPLFDKCYCKEGYVCISCKNNKREHEQPHDTQALMLHEQIKSLESRLKEAERKGFGDGITAEREKTADLRKRLSQAEAENKRLKEIILKRDTTIEQAWLLLKGKDNG